jgi:hypothetical protein
VFSVLSIDPVSRDRVLFLGEGVSRRSRGELDPVLGLGEPFLGELKLVLELVEGFLKELKLVLEIVEFFCLLVQQPCVRRLRKNTEKAVMMLSALH